MGYECRAIGIPTGKELSSFAAGSLTLSISLGTGATLAFDAARLQLMADGVEPGVELGIHTIRHASS